MHQTQEEDVGACAHGIDIRQYEHHCFVWSGGKLVALALQVLAVRWDVGGQAGPVEVEGDRHRWERLEVEEFGDAARRIRKIDAEAG